MGIHRCVGAGVRSIPCTKFIAQFFAITINLAGVCAVRGAVHVHTTFRAFQRALLRVVVLTQEYNRM